MLRRKTFKDEAVHHDRWLVSYADFITLLFAFFVVMYTSSTVNQKKYEALSSSISSAFSLVRITPIKSVDQNKEAVQQDNLSLSQTKDQKLVLIDPIDIGKLKRDQYLAAKAKMDLTRSDLIKKLKPLIDQGKISVAQVPRGIRIDIQDNFLFAPGSAKISSPLAINTLTQITPILVNSSRPIDIEGHTDNRPINNKEYSSNWELSALRATAVLRILNQEGLNEEHLSATGFASSRPIDSNETSQGRAKNRRVSIFVIQDGSTLKQ